MSACPKCGIDHPLLPRPVLVDFDDWPGGVSDGLTLPCHFCDRNPVIDYQVTDVEWARVVPEVARLGVVCIDCFITRGGIVGQIREIQVIAPGATVVLQPRALYHYPVAGHWMDDEYEAAKERNASLPAHARLVITGADMEER